MAGSTQVRYHATAATIPHRPGTSLSDRVAEGYPTAGGGLPTVEEAAGSYLLRFASSLDDLEAVLRLRFQVFNLELGEGLDESFRTGLDEDGLDPWMHHLVVVHRGSGATIGTYRMQTRDMAVARRGFYSAGEFDLSGLPDEMLAQSVEVGRAAVAREHRNGRVLHLLWRGLASYLSWNRKRYLFGCCSLTSQDPALGARVHRQLASRGLLHPVLRVVPRPGMDCGAESGPDRSDGPDAPLPALFATYLNLGAKVCGPPAIDRLFKTIDFLVVLDLDELDERVRRSYFR